MVGKNVPSTTQTSVGDAEILPHVVEAVRGKHWHW